MKKSLFMALVISLGFVACKENSDVEIQTEKGGGTGTKEELIPVTLTVSGFRQSFEKLSSVNTDSEPLSKYISTLHYLVYDENGQEVKRLRYDSSMKDFGVVMDSLKKGVYDIILIGVNGDVLINGDRYPEKSLLKLHEGARFELFHGLDPEIKCYDTFFYRTSVYVDNEDVNSSISLQRVVGAVEINIEDIIPKNAAQIATSLTGEHYIFDFGNERTSEPYLDANILDALKDSDRGKKNYKIKLFTLNTSRPMLLKLTCYDKANNIIAQKAIGNVKCERNRKLVLSGKLFNDTNITSGQVVYVDADWEDNMKTVKF